ncbi:hypothetical protein R1sor_000845 [Riccia sorocarpa]|uniref:Uncharacterized protein n=1 Tax=Riccia sorocarpa TaxID=122646 RepID=A0ABD3GV62_9MARC
MKVQIGGCWRIPFLMEDGGTQPFMKLRSCFHTFHRPRGTDNAQPASFVLLLQPSPPVTEAIAVYNKQETRQPLIFPPLYFVCACVFRILNVPYLRRQNKQDAEIPDSVLTAEELERRARFNAVFEAQLAVGGIVEEEVILSGMIEEEPPATIQISDTETPSGDQISPTSTVESPGTSSPSVSEMNRTGVEHGCLKANSQPKTESAGKGVVRGRRGGRRGASQTVSRRP